MITCTKTYRDIPLSHRQPFHEGRCSRLHGHSWAITLTFEAKELDGNGFVIDFGDLHFLKDSQLLFDQPRMHQVKVLYVR